MHRAKIILLVASIGIALAPSIVRGQEAMERSEASDDLQWPRVRDIDNQRFTVYQPQLESWEDHETLVGRAAVAVGNGEEEEPVYGSMRLTARTVTSFESRQVRIEALSIDEVHFPSLPPGRATELESTIRQALPAGTFDISLDRVLASLERSDHQAREIEVSLEPPPIYRSETASILVIFVGEPRFEPIEGTGLLFAVNTNWDLFLDSKRATYYLLNEGAWLATSDVTEGRWRAAKELPDDFSKLPEGDNWDDVREKVPGVLDPLFLPEVYVSTRPAELIRTEGPPDFVPISGTSLLYARNTDSYLFRHSVEDRFYVLVAGRWFRAENLDGPWSAATEDLPGDFAKIPRDSPVGDVLASVPGTEDAELAVIQASIPRKAKVDRKGTTLTVEYEGEPDFVEIAGLDGVTYAVNTAYDVFGVDGKFFCCDGGIWFVAASATGPWSVATSVPAVLHEIPSTHPKHNVTYVYVYDYDDDSVYVGYTSGYHGAYVASGLLLFGAGFWLGSDHVTHYHYYPPRACWYSYGCAAHYNHYHGGYYRAARYHGPYGGAGRGAWYNARTGTYGRARRAYGPRGSAWAGEAFNPHTGVYASHRGARSPYASRGRTVVSDGDRWARVTRKSGPRGTVVAGQTSEGGKVVRGSNPRTGDSFVAARNDSNDVYVGRDGNIYKHNAKRGWSSYSKGKWNRVAESSKGREPGSSPEVNRTNSQKRAGPVPATRSKRSSVRRASPTGGSPARETTVGRLDHEARRRTTGSHHTSRATTYRSHGSNRGGRTTRGGGRRRR